MIIKIISKGLLRCNKNLTIWIMICKYHYKLKVLYLKHVDLEIVERLKFWRRYVK